MIQWVRGPGICIFNKFAGKADVAVSRDPTLRTAGVEGAAAEQLVTSCGCGGAGAGEAGAGQVRGPGET